MSIHIHVLMAIISVRTLRQGPVRADGGGEWSTTRSGNRRVNPRGGRRLLAQSCWRREYWSEARQSSAKDNPPRRRAGRGSLAGCAEGGVRRRKRDGSTDRTASGGDSTIRQ